jgi:hypothetical protein
MIACREMRLWFQHHRLRPARRAGPTTDTDRQTHSGVGVGVFYGWAFACHGARTHDTAVKT